MSGPFDIRNAAFLDGFVVNLSGVAIPTPPPPPPADPPTLDGSVGWEFFDADGSAASGSLTTALTDDTIVVAVVSSNFGGSGSSAIETVSAVTGGTLTFVRVGGISGTVASSGFDDGFNIEFWSAPSALALTSEAITVTLTGTVTNGCAVAFGVNGATLPFDPNGSLPATDIEALNTGIYPSVTINTSNGPDLLIFAAGGPRNQGNGIPPSAFTLIKQVNSVHTHGTASLTVSYSAVVATQSGRVITPGHDGFTAHSGAAIAIAAAAT